MVLKQGSGEYWWRRPFRSLKTP